MSKIIKCPICHGMAGIIYSENRVYTCRCHNKACRETTAVTAPSQKRAEELFAQFERSNHKEKKEKDLISSRKDERERFVLQMHGRSYDELLEALVFELHVMNLERGYYDDD